MPEVARIFFFSTRCLEKLGKRGITAAEVEQMRWNPYEIRPNPRERSLPRQERRRRLLTGTTDGGRKLTLVIEVTADPTAWLVITGWNS